MHIWSHLAFMLHEFEIIHWKIKCLTVDTKAETFLLLTTSMSVINRLCSVCTSMTLALILLTLILILNIHKHPQRDNSKK